MKNTMPFTLAVVEDDNLVRQTYINRLTLLGYQVVIEAENGKEFPEKLKNSVPPDVCLLDINMPEMEGFEITKQLIQRWPKIKILLFSIHNETAYIDHG